MSKTVFVPRLMDAANLNPQNKNAQALLSRWRSPDISPRTLTYDAAESGVRKNNRVEIHSLWRRHLWSLDLTRQYLRDHKLIFYPGGHAADIRGIRWRKRLGYKAPIVATIEGLIGNRQLEGEYSEIAGHPVYCQHVKADGLACWDGIFSEAVHIIAISPFLAKMGSRKYGDKFSVLPLGIDTSIFHCQGRQPTGKRLRPRVISAGRVEPHKRPEVMLELAKQFPAADFIWFGEGTLRPVLIRQSQDLGLINLRFPGSLPTQHLADEFRQADIFVMPSKSEGVPKVTQEAAACGLAQVIFGFYEAPTVEDGVNGFVVWDDEQFILRVAELISDSGLTQRFGERGAAIALELWDWDLVAPRWEAAICRFLER